MLRWILLAIVVCQLVEFGVSYSCKEETIFGITIEKSCPGPLDARDAIYCCGVKENRKCCKTPLGLDEEFLEDVAKSIPKIIGVIVVGLIVIVISLLVCCCCCPFCLLAKRRRRGTVHQPEERTSEPTNRNTSYAPVQSPPYPTQSGYPQQAPYPQAPYPTTPYATNDQPPPYSEKQQAYNPNY